MHVKRTATIVVAGGALAAWLSAAMNPTGHRGVSFPPTKPGAIESRSADLAGQIARLHERLRPDAAPRQPSRNLFAFQAAPSRRAPAAASAAAFQPPVEPALAPSVAPPSLKLSGIAEDPGPDGPIRTAVISGDAQLFFVKEDENVTDRYRVKKISADSVELADLLDGSMRRLVMR
jgi:hypothetical protein